MRIVILDLGFGNLGSIQNMIKHIGYNASFAYSVDDIKNADKIILPGVGHYDFAIEKLRNNIDIMNMLEEEVLINKKPFLGICLGMQLLFESSEEGKLSGLGWFSGRVKKINDQFKIPHMGWNYINPTKNNSLLNGLNKKSKFYFAHSYYIDKNENSIAATKYGISFSSIIAKDNIYAVQFHPEKSHSFGKQILKNFIEL